MRYIVVFTGVFGGGLLTTWAVAGWDTAVDLAKSYALLAALGLFAWPVGMFMASKFEELDA